MIRNARVRANRSLNVSVQRHGAPQVHHQDVLDDVLEHSRITARGWTWRGLTISLLRMLWGVALVVGTALGITWSVYHYATSSPRFAIKDIQLHGLVRVAQPQIIAESGISVGENLFRLNLGQVEKRLLKNPWISRAKVSRKLPSSINVDIEEREALALAVISSRLFLVNRLGESFKEVEPGDPSDMPLITGVSVDEGPRDVSLFRQRITLGLDVLNHYARSHLSKTYTIEEVHITPGGEVDMTLGHRGTTLHLGAGPWSKKFAMAERILARLQAQRSMPAQIFLDNRANPDRVVVRVN